MPTLRDFCPPREFLVGLLAGLPALRIAVVGDFFLDRYFVVDPRLDEPSLETGLSAHQVVQLRGSPGAAGTIVNNLVSLGVGQIHVVGIIGNDGHGFELRQRLAESPAVVDHLIVSNDRFTPTYIKPMHRVGEGEQEHERFDILNRSPTPASLEIQVIRRINEVVSNVDAVILLDQVILPDSGAITDRVRRELPDVARRHPRVLFLADSRAHIRRFQGVMIKPNSLEAILATGLACEGPPPEADVRRAGMALFERTQRPVFISLGSKGILVTAYREQFQVPAIPLDGPIDVTGAGDSATAALVSALCREATLSQAAFFGNLVASITVKQLGTTGCANAEQVMERFDKVFG